MPDLPDRLFTVTERDALLDALVDRARGDADVIAAAILGSAAVGQQDRWSDIDPAAEFRPHGPAFRVLFGEALPASEPTESDPERTIGMAWLYGLHVRSALARGRTWQAVIMLDQLRDRFLELACLRQGLNPSQGRGADQLPAATLTALAEARAVTLQPAELARSAAALLECLLREVAVHDQELAHRLEPVLRQLGEDS